MRFPLPLVASRIVASGALLLVACSSGGDGGGGGGTTDPDASSANDAGTGGTEASTNTGDAATSAGCEALGKGCVDLGSSIRLSLAFDDSAHPVAAYGASDGIRVRRWNDTKWEALGAPIANRKTLSTFRAHALGSKIVLVSLDDAEATGRSVHVQTYSGTDWADVAGSPFTVSAGSGGPEPLQIDSTSDGAKIYIICASDGGIDPFHVKSFDGTSLGDETVADGALGSRAATPRIDVASDGSLATVYGSQNLYLTKNVAGGTDWTLGTGALPIESNDAVAYSLTPTGAVVAVLTGHRTSLVASLGDGATWSPLGPNGGVVDTATLGNPASARDAADHVIVAYPVYTNDTNIITRAKAWNGTAWTALGDSPSTLAPRFYPATLATAIHGKTLGAIASRRSDVAIEYIGYDERQIP